MAISQFFRPFFFSTLCVLCALNAAAQPKVYFSISLPNEDAAIYKADLDLTNVETLVSGINLTFAAAWEPDSEKLYTIKSTNDSIVAYATDGKSSTILSDLSTPQGLAIDTTNDRIYFSQGSPSRSIYSAKLDGTDLQVVANIGTSAEANVIRLDISDGKIYWADLSSRVIKSVDIATGMNITTIVDEANRDSSGLGEFALDTSTDTIFYCMATDSTSSTIFKVSTSGGAASPFYTYAGYCRAANFDSINKVIYISGDPDSNFPTTPNVFSLDPAKGTVIKGTTGDYTAYTIAINGKARIVTPSTQPEPPDAVVQNRNITITMEKFNGATTTTTTAQGARVGLYIARAKSSKTTFKYESIVSRKSDKNGRSVKGETRIRQLSKNSYTLKNQKTGTYSSKYRTIITKRSSSGRITGTKKSRYSKSITFSVN